MLLLRSNPSKSCSASVILPASAVYKVLRRSTMFIALRSLIVLRSSGAHVLYAAPNRADKLQTRELSTCCSSGATHLRVVQLV